MKRLADIKPSLRPRLVGELYNIQNPLARIGALALESVRHESIIGEEVHSTLVVDGFWIRDFYKF
jgi:hypothetical protein